MLVFPEGRKGTEKLYKDRYRLRRFGRGGFVEAAMRAGAPIVPVAVVGAEEAMPAFAQLGAAAAAHRAHLLPDHADLPALRAARLRRLPAGEVQHPLPRADPDDDLGEEPWEDRALVQTIAEEVRARIQEELVDMLGKRALGRGSDDLAADPRHRAVDATGAAGSPRRSSATRASRRSSASTRRTRRASSSARSSSASAPSTRCCAGSSTPRRSTPSSTRGWWSTRPRRRARDAHENNVIGTMNILAACGGPDSPVRKFVFKSSRTTTAPSSDDPAFFTEEMRRPHPPRTRLERDIVEAEQAVADFAASNPDVTVTVLRFANVLGPDVAHVATRALLSLPVVPDDPRLRPALPVHPRGRHRRRARSTRSPRPAGHLQRRRRRRARALGGRRPARQAATRRCCRRGGRPSPPAALRRLGIQIPPEMLGQLRFGRGSTTASSRRPAQLRYTTRETVIDVRRAPARCAVLRVSATPYRYEREVEEFLRWSPHVRRSEAEGAPPSTTA